MNEFRQKFLREFLEPLAELHRRVAGEYSNPVRRDAMCVVHSIKGCSRTFGLNRAAEIAADLESVLESGTADEIQRGIVLERLTQLIDAMNQPTADGSPPAPLRRSASENRICSHFVGIETELFDLLSEPERKQFLNSLENGAEPFLVRESIPNDNFTHNFGKIRSRLEKAAEFVAVIPTASDRPERCDLQILVACQHDQLPDAKDFRALRLESPDPAVTEIVNEAATHVTRLAADSGKSVKFRSLVNNCQISGRQNTVFESILHLAANAVDHGIVSSGTVELTLLRTADGLRLTVSDDGAGISPEAIGSMFEPGFTTSGDRKPNSGRGYGLFVVKSKIDESNGKISVESRKDFGTRFEITLPN